jgi:hypothetical protein
MKSKLGTFLGIVLLSGCVNHYTPFLKQTNKVMTDSIRTKYARGLKALEKYEKRPKDLTEADLKRFDDLTATIARVVSSGKPRKELAGKK